MDFRTATKQPLYLAALLAAIFLICTGPAHADDSNWPREVTLESGLLTIYQPQVDGLKNDILSFRAAVSFKEAC